MAIILLPQPIKLPPHLNTLEFQKGLLYVTFNCSVPSDGWRGEWVIKAGAKCYLILLQPKVKMMFDKWIIAVGKGVLRNSLLMIWDLDNVEMLGKWTRLQQSLQCGRLGQPSFSKLKNLSSSQIFSYASGSKLYLRQSLGGSDGRPKFWTSIAGRLVSLFYQIFASFSSFMYRRS